MEPTAERWAYGDAFQIQVLALCLRDPQFLPRYIDVVDHSYFEQQDLSSLAYLVLSFFKSKGSVPNRDTVECLVHDYSQTYDKGGSQGLEPRLRHWVNYVYDRPADTDYIVSKIVRFAQRQAIKLAMVKSIDILEQDRPMDEGEGVAEKISQEIGTACLKGAARDFGLQWSKVALRLPQMIRDSAVYKTKVPTSLTALDEDLNGGLGAGELGVICGPPNKGKSTMLTVLGAHAAYFLYDDAQKKKIPPKSVVHITLEMGEGMIGKKYGACQTGMTIVDAVRGGPEYEKRMSEDLKRQSEIWIKHFPPGSTSVEALQWYIANLVVVENLFPGMIIVDYADRLKGGEEDRFRGMGKIYDGLIGIGLKFGCPVWTGSQVRRFDANNNVIDETGVAESWKKVEAADVLLTMNQTQKEYQRNILRLYAVKARDGRARNTYWCKFSPDRVLLRELTDEEIKEAETLKTREDSEARQQEGMKGVKVYDSRQQGSGRAKPPAPVPSPVGLPAAEGDFFSVLPS